MTPPSRRIISAAPLPVPSDVRSGHRQLRLNRVEGWETRHVNSVARPSHSRRRRLPVLEVGRQWLNTDDLTMHRSSFRVRCAYYGGFVQSKRHCGINVGSGTARSLRHACAVALRSQAQPNGNPSNVDSAVSPKRLKSVRAVRHGAYGSFGDAERSQCQRCR
jgi:hypothetical protein